MSWMLALACAEWDAPGRPDGDTGYTGEVTVDPDLAVVAVAVDAVGPDVRLTVETATPVSRLVEVAVNWFDGSVSRPLVSVEGGLGEALVALPTPCEQVGVTQDVFVSADGLTWSRSVLVEGEVVDRVLSLDPRRLLVTCEETAYLSAVQGEFYLRATAGLLEGSVYNPVQGATAWSGTTARYLDGTYDFAHRAPPYELLVWGFTSE